MDGDAHCNHHTDSYLYSIAHIYRQAIKYTFTNNYTIRHVYRQAIEHTDGDHYGYPEHHCHSLQHRASDMDQDAGSDFD